MGHKVHPFGYRLGYTRTYRGHGKTADRSVGLR